MWFNELGSADDSLHYKIRVFYRIRVNIDDSKPYLSMISIVSQKAELLVCVMLKANFRR